MLKKLAITSILLHFSVCIFAQESKTKNDAEREALFIYNFSKYITWSNFNSLTEFKIGVIGDDYNYICSALTKISETKDVKGIPLKIERVNYDTKLDELQLIYFDNPKTTDIKTLYKTIKNNPVLLVGKGYPFGQSMINFIDVNGKIEFELDENKCKKAGLTVNIVIKTLAIKTRREWQSLIEKMETITLQDENKVEVNTKDLETILMQQKQLEKEIALKKEALTFQNNQLALTEKTITEKEALIEASTIELNKQKELVARQNKKLSTQQKNLNELNFTIVSKQIKLAEQQEKLEKDKAKLKSIKAEVRSIENELKEKAILVAQNETQIKIQNNELKNKSSKIEQQKHIIWLSVLFLIIVSILGLLAYRSYKLKNKANKIVIKQKQEIELQHKEIIDSINYAKRLQEAIFPPIHLVKEVLPNSFVYFNPKNVVSGDFYWMEIIQLNNLKMSKFENKQTVAPNSQINTFSNSHILFAVADCTGHGVPGAMVSVVCNNALNRSVREYGLTDVGEILDKTREIVVSEFAKSNEDVKDGMDIALCSLRFDVRGLKLKNKETTALLQYAGANNPLWIIRNLEPQTSNFELIEIKATKQPIGKIDQPSNFQQHIIELQKGDTIYIFSDGFADQFGGPKSKKMMYKPFKQFLFNIQEKTMGEQKELLAAHFEKWKGTLEQVDDVCVLGVRI